MPISADHSCIESGDEKEAAFCIDGGDGEEDGTCAPCSQLPLHIPQPKHLSLVPLAILTFYNVSGGPFGIEASVRAGGNFFAILGFLILPFVWSVPEAAVTAELGSAYPEASGGVAWVEEAFGQKAGLMAGYLGWVAGATDNRRPLLRPRVAHDTRKRLDSAPDLCWNSKRLSVT